MYLETTFVLNDPEVPVPLKLLMAGITHPAPNYHMNRWGSPCGYYILEAVISGKGILETSDTTYYLEPGDAYIIPQGSVCEYRSLKQDPWEKIWFNVRGELLNTLCALYKINNITVFKNIDMGSDFAKALEIVKNNRSNAYSELSLALHGIINKFYIFSQKNATPEQYSPEAVKLKNFLDSAWMRKVSQQDLCKLINKSPAQMQRIFKCAWGVSPGQYIQDKRLKMAIQYLSNTKFTIRRIAAHVGFSNEYYFANWFKEKTGYAPKSYCQQNDGQTADNNQVDI